MPTIQELTTLATVQDSFAQARTINDAERDETTFGVRINRRKLEMLKHVCTQSQAKPSVFIRNCINNLLAEYMGPKLWQSFLREIGELPEKKIS